MSEHRKSTSSTAASRIADPLTLSFPLQMWNMAFTPLDVLACDAALEATGMQAEQCLESSFRANGVGAELTSPQVLTFASRC